MVVFMGTVLMRQLQAIVLLLVLIPFIILGILVGIVWMGVGTGFMLAMEVCGDATKRR